MSNQNKIEEEGVYAPEVLEFVRSANDYCSWLEEDDSSDGVAFIRFAVQHLSKIYHQAVNLKEIEPMMEGGNEKFVSEQDWSLMFQKVLNILGRHNSYLRIADGDEFDRSDLVTHNISEDLSDIYQDLKDFTLQYRQGIEEIMNDAVWEVMDNFENFWSEKLLNALLALNKLHVNKTDPSMDAEAAGDIEDESNPTYDNSFFRRHQAQNEEEI